VKKPRVRIKTVGPHNRAQVLVDAHLLEILRVAKRLTERPAKQERAVDVSADAVAELKMKMMAIEGGGLGDAQHEVLSLSQGIDWDQRFEGLG